MRLTPKEFAEGVAEMLRTRKGELLTEDVIRERANNIAAAFTGCRIGTEADDAAAEKEALNEEVRRAERKAGWDPNP